MCTVKIGAATAGRKKLRKRIIPAAIEAADAGRPTIECIHPNRISPHRPEPAPQIRVLAARLRNRRAQFRVGQRAKNRKHRADDPRGKHDRNRVAFPRHFRRLQENARPNHRANHNRQPRPTAPALAPTPAAFRSYPSAQFGVRRLAAAFTAAYFAADPKYFSPADPMAQSLLSLGLL